MKRAWTEAAPPPRSGESHAQKRARLVQWQALSVEQREVITWLLTPAAQQGRSIFITGPAGSGKSTVLRAAIRTLRGAYARAESATTAAGRLAVTASTGIAANAVGGETLHRFAGIGLGQDSVEELLVSKWLKPGTKAWRRWRNVDTLVIDEISMIAGELLDKLDALARAIRQRPDDAFGGIRLVLVGDFLQLPPVKGSLAFDSAAWQALQLRTFALQQVHRQSEDSRFAAILGEVRVGECSDETRALLEAHTVERLPPLAPGVLVTHMMPHNATVDGHNAERLEALEGAVRTYVAKDWKSADEFSKQLELLLVPARLELKVGAQVMLLKNLDVPRGLFNGAQGVVVGYASSAVAEEEVCVLVRFENGLEVPIGRERFAIEINSVEMAARDQVPLRLSWAITVHKTQSMTITTTVEIDAGQSIFAYGQTYVALSRLQRLEQLRLKAFAPQAIRAHPRVLEWTRALVEEPLRLTL